MKKTVFIILLSASFCTTILAQEMNSLADLSEWTVFANTKTNAEISPKPATAAPISRSAEFPGGMTALRQYLLEHITYSERAREYALEGIVKVKFAVNPDGTLGDFQILQSPNIELDKCALAVIESMPNWNSALWEGQAVKTKVVVAINFSLT